jgi:hypothetical protein
MREDFNIRFRRIRGDANGKPIYSVWFNHRLLFTADIDWIKDWSKVMMAITDKMSDAKTIGGKKEYPIGGETDYCDKRKALISIEYSGPEDLKPIAPFYKFAKEE